MQRRIVNVVWIALWCCFAGGTASAQTGTCVDDFLWRVSTDGDHAYADYAACLRPQEPSIRLHCRNGSPAANILVMLGAHVSPNEHVSLTFHTNNRSHQINGVTYWDDFHNIAGFDANLNYDDPLISAMTQSDTFAVETFEVHMVDAAAAISSMLAHCGRG